MEIGLFFHPCGHRVLVALDYPSWQAQILAAGFPSLPGLTRKATTPEVVAYEEREEGAFPAWIYDNFEELLEDEEHSGASVQYLEALLRLLVRYSDQSPTPQRTANP